MFGCDLADPISALEEMDFVHADTRLSVIGKLIRRLRIDTLVHLAVLVDSPHDARSTHETNVIGTMNVLVGCAAPSSPVRRLVVKSSQAIYGAGPNDPSFFAEDMVNFDRAASGLTRDLLEMEQLVSEFTVRNEGCDATVLRLGLRVSEGTSLARYLSLPIVPTFAGFDPRLQLMHEDDAVEAIVRATMGRHPGVFNVAGDGRATFPPRRHHRFRLCDGLLASRVRLRVEAFLQLSAGDGRAGDGQAGRAHRCPIAATGIRAPDISPTAPPKRAPAEPIGRFDQPRRRGTGFPKERSGVTQDLIAPTTPRERRRNSQKAEIVVPPREGFRLPKPIRRLQRRAPMYAIQGLSDLATRLREMTGREVIDMNRIMEMLQFIYQQRELARRGANYEVDDFGFDAQWTESFITLFKSLYRDYWRVETVGVEHVPATGRALLVANHAGVLPWDGTMIKTAVFTEHSHPRHVRALVASQFMGMPVMSWFLRRTGQAVGHPDDTRRLLERDELVLVFPEGTRGTGKSFHDRYRLRRFGRGGFVATAIRARAPIIPISVVGSEEIYPMVGDLRPLAKLLGLPYFPVTPFWPWLGPLGMIPLPSKWRIQFHPPIEVADLPLAAAEDQHQVMALADEVRETIQRGVYDNLKLRRGVFL